MKITKLSVMALVIITLITMATSVSAYTSAELENYITGTHTISGSQFELKAAEKQEVKDYLASNPLTDAQATQIKSLLDEAKNKISATGASNLNQIAKSTKAEVVALLKEAGNVAGLTVSVDTSAKTITVSKAGTVIVSGSYAMEGNGGVTVRTYTNPASVTKGGSTISGFVYTGSNNTVLAIVAVLAVVAVSTIVVRKVYAK